MMEGDLWAIWANHDCLNWEVLLTFAMDRETTENVIASTGVSDLLTSLATAGSSGEEGCELITTDQGTQIDKCVLRMRVGAENFALLIKGGFQPIWYDFKWVYLGEHAWMSRFFPF